MGKHNQMGDDTSTARISTYLLDKIRRMAKKQGICIVDIVDDAVDIWIRNNE